MSGPARRPPAVERVVSELLQVVDGIVPTNVRRDLEASLERLREERANLVVLGEFKRGKSTLANALVGSEIVPTGVLPLTAMVTAIRHGPAPRVVVIFESGERLEIGEGQVADFATEAGNPGNVRGAKLLTIELPAPLLAAGIQLVDTPGIGSIFAHNTETALAFLGQVDAAIFVLAADQPLSKAEEELIRTAAARIPQIFFVLNKLDQLGKDERAASVAFVRDRLRECIACEPELFPLSARNGDGVGALRRRLESFGETERNDVLAASARSLAASFAVEAAQAVRFEAHAVELPVAELEGKLNAFRDRAQALERAREEAGDLLHQAMHRLVADTVNQPLLTLASREGAALGEALRAFAAAQGRVSPHVLARRLGEWTDEAIHDRFEQLASELEADVASTLAGLHARYARRVSDILGQLEAAAAEVFGARAGRRAPEVRLRQSSGFTFKLHDVREPLDQLASLAAASAPSPLGRRLVLRQAEERLQLMLDRHAGRLRSDLAARIDTSVRTYERELASVVADAVTSIEAAVERAAAEQQRGRDRVVARLDELGRMEQRITELEHDLNSLATPAGAGPQPEGATR